MDTNAISSKPFPEVDGIDNIVDTEQLKAIIKEKTNKAEALKKQLDEFVYIVSHDLKAPLRGLVSLTVFLEEEIGNNTSPEAKDLFTMIRGRSARMQNLIEAILHYSRTVNNESEKEQIDLELLLTNIIDGLNMLPTLKVEIQKPLPTLVAQKNRLKEIFKNLIDNAAKFNKTDGEVKISFKDLGESFQFTIEDTGIGIKEEHFQKIFGVFHTLQPKDKTTNIGMGLTLAKKLIEDAGGKIWLESEVGVGSKFHFTWVK